MLLEDEQQERILRATLNAASLPYTIQKHHIILHGAFQQLEEVRLQLLQSSIKFPMMPSEGAAQLTIRLANEISCHNDFRGACFHCRVGTIECLPSVRLQTSHENPLINRIPISLLREALAQQVSQELEDLTLEHVSLDGGWA